MLINVGDVYGSGRQGKDVAIQIIEVEGSDL